MKCENCNAEMKVSPQMTKKYCDDFCKNAARYQRVKNREGKEPYEYDASSIVVKDFPQDIWHLSASLSIQYKIPSEPIQRGLEACRLAGVNHSYYIERYLDNNKTVEQNMEVDVIYRELLNERRIELER